MSFYQAVGRCLRDCRATQSPHQFTAAATRLVELIVQPCTSTRHLTRIGSQKSSLATLIAAQRKAHSSWCLLPSRGVATTCHAAKRRRIDTWPHAQQRALSISARVYERAPSENHSHRRSLHTAPTDPGFRVPEDLSEKDQRAYHRLRPILDDLPGPISWAVAYGSGVRHQANAQPNAVSPSSTYRLLLFGHPSAT
jgi:hypothetical protein